MKNKILRILALVFPALSLSAAANEPKAEQLTICAEDGKCITADADEVVSALSSPNNEGAKTLYEKLKKAEVLKKQSDSDLVNNLAMCGGGCSAPTD